MFNYLKIKLIINVQRFMFGHFIKYGFSFIKRFEIMEKLSNKENKNFSNLNKNEQELLWEKSKKFI